MNRRDAVTVLGGFMLAAGGAARPAAAIPAHRQTEPDLGGVDAWIKGAMADWRVPGLSVAVVKDDRVVLAKGYGVRALDGGGAVDADTVFAIGSTTKGFTSALIGTLADEGRMRWDGPVIDYLPSFRLADPWTTRELTLRDVLVHRSGLARADMLWHGSGHDRAEIVRRMRHLPQRWPFRTRYDYSNLGYILAGEAAAAVAGMRWEELLSERLLGPLEMTRSSAGLAALDGLANVASPHWMTQEAVTRIPWLDLTNLGPAGSINSSANDLARWLRLQLADGKIGERTLVSSRSLRTTRAPLIVTPFAADPLFPTTHYAAYGMGWAVGDYQGRDLKAHAGEVDGMKSQLALVPGEKLGVAVLTNAEGHDLTTAVMYRLLDLWLGVESRDWSAALLERAREQENGQEDEAPSPAPSGPAPASLPLEAYAGTYLSDLYGDAGMAVESGALRLRFGPLHTARLAHRRHDVFAGAWSHPRLGTAVAAFGLTAEGAVGQFQLGDMGVFARKP